MHPKKAKGLSLGFQFFEYLGLGVMQFSCKFRKRIFKILKKNLAFAYGFEHQF